MTDLTPERRAELRHYAEVVQSADYETTMLAHYGEMLALLDAADERDRLAEIDSRLSVLLWRLTNGRLSKTSYPVEFMEQEIEECLAKYHESDLRDERDRLAAALRQIAEACHWSHDPTGDPEALVAYIGQLQRSADDALDAAERVRALHEREELGFCVACDYMTPHPCPTIRALDGTDE